MQITERQVVAANIRAAAAIPHVSEAAIAAAVGLSPNAMSRRMTGDMEFRISELQAIAAFLKTTIDALLAPAEDVA